MSDFETPRSWSRPWFRPCTSISTRTKHGLDHGLDHGREVQKWPFLGHFWTPFLSTIFGYPDIQGRIQSHYGIYMKIGVQKVVQKWPKKWSFWVISKRYLLDLDPDLFQNAYWNTCVLDMGVWIFSRADDISVGPTSKKRVPSKNTRISLGVLKTQTFFFTLHTFRKRGARLFLFFHVLCHFLRNSARFGTHQKWPYFGHFPKWPKWPKMTHFWTLFGPLFGPLLDPYFHVLCIIALYVR